MITKEFLKKNLKLNDKDALSLFNTLKSSPETQLDILAKSESEILKRIMLYKSLGLALDKLANNAYLLKYDLSSNQADAPHGIKSKIYNITKLFNITNEELFSKDNYLQFLRLDSTHSPEENPFGVQAIAKYYQEELSFTNEQFKACPQLLRYDCLTPATEDKNGMQAKLIILKNLGITKEYLQKHPMVLLTPTEKLPIRYALGFSIFENKDFLNQTQWATFNEEKIFARYCFLKTNEDYILKSSNLLNNTTIISPNLLYTPDAKFESRFNTSTDLILEKYPFTKEVKKSVIKKYQQISAQFENEK